MLQMKPKTSDLLMPLAQLLRFQMKVELQTSDLLALSFNSLDYGLEGGAPNFRFVNPLAQLVRLQVVHTTPNLRVANPPRSPH